MNFSDDINRDLAILAVSNVPFFIALEECGIKRDTYLPIWLGFLQALLIDVYRQRQEDRPPVEDTVWIASEGTARALGFTSDEISQVFYRVVELGKSGMDMARMDEMCSLMWPLYVQSLDLRDYFSEEKIEKFKELYEEAQRRAEEEEEELYKEERGESAVQATAKGNRQGDREKER